MILPFNLRHREERNIVHAWLILSELQTKTLTSNDSEGPWHQPHMQENKKVYVTQIGQRENRMGQAWELNKLWKLVIAHRYSINRPCSHSMTTNRPKKQRRHDTRTPNAGCTYREPALEQVFCKRCRTAKIKRASHIKRFHKRVKCFNITWVLA